MNALHSVLLKLRDIYQNAIKLYPLKNSMPLKLKTSMGLSEHCRNTHQSKTIKYTYNPEFIERNRLMTSFPTCNQQSTSGNPSAIRKKQLNLTCFEIGQESYTRVRIILQKIGQEWQMMILYEYHLPSLRQSAIILRSLRTYFPSHIKRNLPQAYSGPFVLSQNQQRLQMPK